MPRSLLRRTLDRAHPQFRSPLPNLAAPLVDEARRRNDESRLEDLLVEEDAQGRDGLHRLAKTHVVCQQDFSLRNQDSNAVELKRAADRPANRERTVDRQKRVERRREKKT